MVCVPTRPLLPHTTFRQRAPGGSFGASVVAYKLMWAGSGLFHPPHATDDATRALLWAVTSCCERQPVLYVGVLVHSHSAYLSHLMQHSQLHVLTK